MQIIVFFLLLAASSIANAAPPTLTGATVGATSITITGSGFGSSGPSILLYDEFEGTIGNDISLSATVGSWTKYGTYRPQYNSVAHSGSSSMLLYDQSNNNFRQIKKDFPSKVTEIFATYWVQVPENTYFPHNVSVPSSYDSFPDESTWKFLWVMNQETGSPGVLPSDNDICLPTHIGGGLMVVAGNALNIASPYHEIYRQGSQTWWQFGAWNRMAFWLKADESNPSTANGTIWSQGVGANQYAVTQNRPVFGAPGAGSPYQWGHMAFVGWTKPNSTNPTRPVYDDLYVATGPNAASRVEIGNDSTYSNCTRLAIQTPTSWADGSVTVDLRKGGFSAGETAYVFVINASNEASSGRQITIPGGNGGTRYRLRIQE